MSTNCSRGVSKLCRIASMTVLYSNELIASLRSFGKRAPTAGVSMPLSIWIARVSRYGMFISFARVSLERIL